MSTGSEARVDDIYDTLGPVLHPPLFFLGMLIAGLLLQWGFPLPFLARPVARLLGIAALVPGLAFAGSAVIAFRRARTSVAPIRPTRALVTGGPYRISRNPMYVGLTLVYAGIALLFDAPWPLLLLAPLLVILRATVILPEEDFLERLFGNAYRDYQARVRRWL